MSVHRMIISLLSDQGSSETNTTHGNDAMTMYATAYTVKTYPAQGFMLYSCAIEPYNGSMFYT